MVSDSPVRVAVDIGGTFTDLHLHNPVNGHTTAWKTPSTPADPSVGLIEGLRGITEVAGIELSDIGLILHGSTIATNAVLERKLPKGALLTTSGFSDVLEIGRHIRRDVYTLQAEQRSLLIPRHRRYGVTERINADGQVLQTLDEKSLHTAIDNILQEQVETVAIVFLHGYRNPLHEERAAAIVRERAPHLSVTCSCHTSPEIREFERTSTTVLNALLRPVISGYLERVSSRLNDTGITAALYLVQSNGGLATPQDAATLPAKLLLSGPAGGAMAMASLSQRHKLHNLVGFDMGGTSSDISVVRNGQIGETAESTIDGLPVRMPMVEIRTIGAGGGSIAAVQGGALRVGPVSAGADPGPVCYERGGTEPTVTDANAALARIDPAAFQTGGMQLNANASTKALNDLIGEPLELDTATAAEGVLNVATAHMAGAIRLSLFEKGADPGDFALAPFGGAAGLHACAVASELGMSQIIFPANASTLSALGILQADLRYDLSDSQLLPAHDDSLPSLVTSVESLRQQSTALLRKNGFTDNNCRIEISCDMRYRGQAFELATPWSTLTKNTIPDTTTLASLIANFHRIHEERFAHTSPQDAVEIVTIRAVAIGVLDKPDTSQPHATMAPSATATSERKTRTIFVDGRDIEVPCFHRNELQTMDKPLQGPAIIEEDYTVLLIEKNWRLQAMPGGDLQGQYVNGDRT